MGSSTGLGSFNVQTDVQQAGEQRLLHQMKSQKGTNDDAKISKGARDFEAILVGSWLQQAEKSFATVPGGDEDEDAAGRDQIMGLGIQGLASSIAASGGIGIGKMMAKAMHASEEKENAPLPAPVQSPSGKR